LWCNVKGWKYDESMMKDDEGMMKGWKYDEVSWSYDEGMKYDDMEEDYGSV